LRQRLGDIPLLVHHFLGEGWTIEPEAMDTIEKAPWPGNVRQLANAIERAKILADSKVLRVQDLPRELGAPATIAVRPGLTLDSDNLATLERRKVVDVLKRERGNKARAARAMGIDRRKLYRLLEKYAIQDAELAATG
jgi:DNA-binding NtrC family response regulator